MPDPSFGVYLRQRRAMMSPRDAGIPETARRRVPGLRRDEVARLVAVSVDYYTRLEQERVGRPSDAVLEALAVALRLGVAERQHLFDLAGHLGPAPRRPRASRPQRGELRRGLCELVDRMPLPALVMTDTTRIVRWNPLAAALFGGPETLGAEPVFCARLVFLDPVASARHADWDAAARDTVGMLRLVAGRRPDDPELAALVGELVLASAPFRSYWGSQHVHEKTHGGRVFRHPLVGDLELDYESLRVPDDERLLVMTYGARNRAAEDGLALLGAHLARRESPRP